MYTPIDIQQKKFKGGMGYKKKDVDVFMANLLESYEYLYKENMELNEKIRNLTNSLTQYKSIEKSLQKALILAQSAAEDVKETANASARLIEEEAKSKARDIVLEARKDYDDIQGKAIAMARQLEVFKTQCKQAAMAQLDLLNGDLYAVDFEKLEKNMLESELESLSFIEKKQEEARIEKNSIKLDEKTEKILEAANKAAESDTSLKAAPTAEEIAKAKTEEDVMEISMEENAETENASEDEAESAQESAVAEEESVLEEVDDYDEDYEDLEVDDEFYSLVAEVMEDDDDDDEDIQF